MEKSIRKRGWKVMLGLTIFGVFLGSQAQAATFTVNSTADVVDASPGNGTCQGNPSLPCTSDAACTAAAVAGPCNLCDTGRTVPLNPVPPDLGVPECTLRAAIQEANFQAGADTIILPAGTYTLTIPGRAEDSAAAGDLDITQDLTITGAGAATTIIDGGGLDRVFHVDPAGSGITVAISGVTIQNGQTIGISFVDSRGGGILLGVGNLAETPSGSLTLTDSIVSNNTASNAFGESSGGGLANKGGTLTLMRTAVTDNNGWSRGGGISQDFFGKLTLNASTVDNNTAAGGGGIFSLGAEVVLINSTLSNNRSNNGGGIYNYRATVHITNSTISGNAVPGSGGGLYNEQGTVELNNSTVTGNSAGTPQAGGTGGGIINGSALTLSNTIVAGNTVVGTPLDCAGFLTSGGYNLIQSDRFPGPVNPSCILVGNLTGNIIGQDARLGPLGDNGGPTQTHALLPGSPAIDAGNPAGCTDAQHVLLATDQRGEPRLADGDGVGGARCDIGAYELVGITNRFSVSAVLPNKAGNGGSVVTVIYGERFASGATVMLRRTGERDIVGNPVRIGEDGVVAATTVDLTGRTPELWDVVLMNPDGTSATLAGGFTIEETRAAQPWADYVLPNAIREGQIVTGYLLFGNRGNTDALSVPLTLVFPSELTLNLLFEIAPPPPQAGQVQTDSNRLAFKVLIGNSNLVHIPLILPVVPAGFTGALKFTFPVPPGLVGSSLPMFRHMGLPFFNPNLDPQVVDVRIARARAIAEREFGVLIPRELDPDLIQYLTNQLRTVVEHGRNALVDSLGTQFRVYSDAQLDLDLAQFGVALAGARSQLPREFIREALARPSGATRERGSKSDHAQTRATRRVTVSSGEAIREHYRSRWAQSMVEDGAEGRTRPVGARVEVRTKASSIVLLTSVRSFIREVANWIYNVIVALLAPSDANAQATIDCSSIHKNCTDVTSCRVGEKTVSACSALNLTICCNTGLSDRDCCDLPDLIVVRSKDPNDKAVSQGVGPEQFLSGEEPLRYVIFFENLATATAPATAPAQVVVVTDQLDANLDLSTFSLGPISFGNKTVVPPPGLSQFTTDVDLRPEKNLIVRIEASLDTNTRMLRWYFTSIDPATGQLTTDPLAGFLPPNVIPPEGEGNVLFTVKPKAGLATGTQICNLASIIFDVNAPIVTPERCNTLDNTPPMSRVSPLAAIQNSSSFPVQWSGSDVGSGIAGYFVLSSENGGQFMPFVSNTVVTSATFTGKPGSTYAFCSLADDLTRNQEEKNASMCSGEATTTINRPPLAQCQDVTVQANASCQASASVDNGSSDPDQGLSTLVQSPPGPYGLGSNSVTLTVTDNAGASASCSANVSVVDNTPPTITCPANQTLECTGPSGANPVVSAIASDNCGSAVVSCNAGPFPIGSTTVACTARDAANNNASCTTTVTVADRTPPTITCPAPLIVECTGNRSAPAVVSATAQDVCDGSVTATCDGSGPFPLGMTDVSCNARDRAGNNASCATSVTVVDTTPPSITCPANQTVSCTGPNGALVSFSSPTASDNCSGSITPSCTQPSGSTFPLGNTLDTCTAIDGSGNQNTCSFTVAITDSAAPTTTASPSPGPNFNGWNNGDVTVNVSAVDNCSGVREISFSLSGAQTGGSVVAGNSASVVISAEGTTTLSYFARDNAENQEATRTLTVRIDKTLPQSQVMALAATQTSLSFPVQWSGTDDRSGIFDYTVFVSENSGPFVAFMSNTDNTSATFTGQRGRSYAFCTLARDTASNVENKNLSPTCPRAAVTFIVANRPPVALCQDVTVPANPSCQAMVSVNNGSSDPDGDRITLSQLPPGPYGLGSTLVNLTVTDDKSASNSCSATVRVVDQTPPAITCPAPQTVRTSQNGGACNATLAVSPMATDNCSGSLTPTCSSSQLALSAPGTTMATCTATDGSSNSANCSVSLTLVDDTPPAITCPADQRLECTGPNGATVSFNARTSDNCSSGITPSCTWPSGTTFPLGNNTTNTCRATDGAGNQSACSFAVNVVDTLAPAIQSMAASPNVLWPPNHQMVPVNVTVSASDRCDPAPSCRITSVSSNEPVDGLGDGRTAPDWEITGNLGLKLRAERSGKVNGRVYTITAICTDASGNGSTKTTTVTVPHDQAKK